MAEERKPWHNGIKIPLILDSSILVAGIIFASQIYTDTKILHEQVGVLQQTVQAQDANTRLTRVETKLDAINNTLQELKEALAPGKRHRE